MREQGYAVAVDELEVGLTAVAAPIRNAHGDVIASMSVSGPTFRLAGSGSTRWSACWSSGRRGLAPAGLGTPLEELLRDPVDADRALTRTTAAACSVRDGPLRGEQ